MPARVLIVDDSAFIRRALNRILSEDAGVEVVGIAHNGREGVELAERLKPDVITMDIEMPEMDGLTALRRIMRQCPTHVIMVSSLTVEGSNAALTALKLGAADVFAKDHSRVANNLDEIGKGLLVRIHALAQASNAAPAAPPARDARTPDLKPGQFDLVCIGSSTGGPPVLETLLTKVPRSLDIPIVVAQHMPELFTKSMADRLNALCDVPVVHGCDGLPVKPGVVTILPGGSNGHLKGTAPNRLRLLVNDLPKEALYRPSVDVLLSSAAATSGKRTLGIVATGMGEDGYLGAKELHAADGTLLAQSAETCVVYGMPKRITEEHLASASLSPDLLAQTLQRVTSPASDLRRAG
ncbi:MAG: chemotaxis response regulator protein-glutamate methylesterase [Planctomycetota bacterium]